MGLGTPIARGFASCMAESVSSKVEGILSGDPEARAWIFDHFAPRLLRKLGQRFGAQRGLDREDLLQDTFLYLFAHLGRALRRFLDQAQGEPDEVALDHFLWNAACGIASNRRRSLLRHPTATLDDRDVSPVLGEEGRSEGRTLARDVLERLARCLLADGRRLVLYFQLRYRDGLKPAEIARATGWSRRATYKLKQSLDLALDLCLKKLEASP